MLKITLEWNAVITLGCPGRPGWNNLKKIVSVHGSNFDVGIVTTAASENTSEKILAQSTMPFMERLAEVGLSSLSIVQTMAVYDLTFYDYARYDVDDDDEIMIEKLWMIPPKGVPRDPREFAAARGIPEWVELTAPEFQKWRNHWCDVYSWHAHIRAKRDVFVTGDKKNFKGDRKQRLIDLGIGDICTYDEAWQRYGDGGGDF